MKKKSAGFAIAVQFEFRTVSRKTRLGRLPCAAMSSSVSFRCIPCIPCIPWLCPDAGTTEHAEYTENTEQSARIAGPGCSLKALFFVSSLIRVVRVRSWFPVSPFRNWNHEHTRNHEQSEDTKAEPCTFPTATSYATELPCKSKSHRIRGNAEESQAYQHL